MTLTELRRIAMVATKGEWCTQGDPWDRSETHDTAVLAGDQDPHMGTVVADCNLTMEWDEGDEDPHGADRRNAAHIAAFHPQQAIALLDQIAELRGALEFYAATDKYWEIMVGGATLRENMGTRAREALEKFK